MSEFRDILKRDKIFCQNILSEFRDILKREKNFFLKFRENLNL